MDSRSGLDQTRKRKRDAAHMVDTIRQQQPRTADPSSSLFLSDSEDEDTVTANSQRPPNPKATSTQSTRPNGSGSQQNSTRKPSQVNNTEGAGAISVGSLPKTPHVKPIKEEIVEEYTLGETPKSPNSVTIYVGKRNAQLNGKREDLVKSHVLNSWIVDDAQQGAYIMRPQLLRLDLTDFEAVLQYIHSGEYAPMLIENVEDPAGLKNLDGLKSDADYARELVRSGRIYVIAQDLKVDGMVDQIYRKVTEVDTTKFTNQSLVEVATIVFRNNRVSAASEVAVTANEQTTICQSEGRLEKWIIGQLAKNFREIVRTTQPQFWRMERETSKRFLFAQVLEEVAKQYRDRGTLPAGLIELE